MNDLYETLVKKYALVEQHKGGVLPSGSMLLDKALTVGGYPAGRIVEIFGPEGVGKTTLGIHALVSGQQKRLQVALIDMECSFDEHYAKAIGIRGKRQSDYIHVVPSDGESAIDIIADLLDGGIKVIVVDSVASMVPRAEYEGDTGEAFMGLQARMMGQGMRKLTGRVSRAEAYLIFMNQVRSKIGQFWGSSEVTTGGRALKFFASVRIQLRDGQVLAGKTYPIGKMIRVKIVKNKVGPPLKETEIPLLFGHGVDEAYEIFHVLCAAKRIERRSSYFYYNGEKFGFGAEDAVNKIAADMKTWRERYSEYQKTQST